MSKSPPINKYTITKADNNIGLQRSAEDEHYFVSQFMPVGVRFKDIVRLVFTDVIKKGSVILHIHESDNISNMYSIGSLAHYAISNLEKVIDNLDGGNIEKAFEDLIEESSNAIADRLSINVANAIRRGVDDSLRNASRGRDVGFVD